MTLISGMSHTATSPSIGLFRNEKELDSLIPFLHCGFVSAIKRYERANNSSRVPSALHSLVRYLANPHRQH